MPMITLKNGCARAIRSFFKTQPVATAGIRIELRFTGCCDASLGLIADNPRESDLVQELDGLIFMVDPNTYETVGDITIDYTDNVSGSGFLLTSIMPVSEWQGFAPCGIEIAAR